MLRCAALCCARCAVLPFIYHLGPSINLAGLSLEGEVRSLLCCAVLCCAVLCHAVSCSVHPVVLSINVGGLSLVGEGPAVLCCAVLAHAALRYAHGGVHQPGGAVGCGRGVCCAVPCWPMLHCAVAWRLAIHLAELASEGRWKHPSRNRTALAAPPIGVGCRKVYALKGWFIGSFILCFVGRCTPQAFCSAPSRGSHGTKCLVAARCKTRWRGDRLTTDDE